MVEKAILQSDFWVAPVRRVILATLFCVAAGAPAFALSPEIVFHDYAIDKWGVDSGLPQVSVSSIAQDRVGYLWIGTQNGLARFDGIRFQVFDRRNSDGVNPNESNHSLCDRHGRLFFGTHRGLVIRENDHFRTLGPPTPINALVETAEGEVWAGGPAGLLRLVGDELLPPAPGESEVHSLARAGADIWSGGVGRLRRHGNGGVETIELPAELAEQALTHLAVAQDGLWIGSPAGLHFWNAATRTLSRQALEAGAPAADVKDYPVESLLRDGDGNLWIGTPSALYRRRPDGRVEHVPDADFSQNSYVLASFEDRDGNLWLGSRTEGLYRLWNGWASRIGERDGLKDRLTWSVLLAPDGQIVLGSNSNVARLTPGGPEEMISAAELDNRAAYELSYDALGRLWVGTRTGLAIFENDRLSTPAEFEPLARMQINAIVPTAQGSAWLGTSGGLFHWTTGKLERVDKASGEPAASVRAIYLGSEGKLLLGTETGLLELDGDALREPAWAKPLQSLFISTIRPIRPGLLGIGTRDAGFGLWNGHDLTLYTKDDGLPSNNAWTQQLVGGQLYVSTIDGVWRVPLSALPNPSSKPRGRIEAEVVLGRTTGIQEILCCNGGAHARSLAVGDDLWYPAIQGVVRVDTRAIAPPTRAPAVVIEGLRNGVRWFAPGTPMRIAGTRRDVELQFTGLSFRDPKNLNFRYRLVGYDQAWQLSGTRRSAFYTNLPPGDYRFEVETMSDFGVAAPGADALEFAIAPRWFERSGMQAAGFVLLFALAAVTPLLLRSRYRRRGELLEALVETRTFELSDAGERQLQANRALSESNALLQREIDERAAAENALQERNSELTQLTRKLEGTQSQLLQSERMASVGQLAAGVAHEINNPIGYVRSNLNSLARYIDDLLLLIRKYEELEGLIAAGDAAAAAQLTELKQRMELDFLREDLLSLLAESQQGIIRVEKIVKDLKDFSHVDKAEWQIVDIHAAIESTLNVVAHDLKYKAELVRDYAPTPPIECLPFQLNQVFLNLLINAVQAIAGQGVITVATRSDEHELRVSVTDTGKGIAPADLHRVFDPFFTTKPVGQGTGLGLSVSYGIVQRHGGHIEVTSKVGVGTTFTVHLPLKRPDDEGAPSGQ